MKKFTHYPVMLEETMEMLALQPGMVAVDATAGLGGHSEAILSRILPGGHLIAIDTDEKALAQAKERLEKFADNITYINTNFANLKDEISKSGFDQIDRILFDLGVSSYQLEDASRGFSFSKEGPLDMRMSSALPTTAEDLVNTLSAEELAGIFVKYGEESEARAEKAARAIVEYRRKSVIDTTTQLAELAGGILSRRGRIHPATKIFMALRIAVNKELEMLEVGLQQGADILKIGGRMAVISFHSLEDRIVKYYFKELKEEGRAMLLNKHVIKPEYAEVRVNPPSRSAKLRVIERLA